MLQLAQNPKSGRVEHLEAPTPPCERGRLLVQTLASVVSAGTERNTVKLGKSSLIRTAFDRPDLVNRVLGKLSKDGLAATYRAVKDRTEQTTALGYSSAGRVLEVGAGVDDIAAGDLVACAGAGFASHAEVVSIPRQLVALIPPEVTAAEAAFTTLGAIALQGVRLAEVGLSDNVAVIGLGLLGQITVQLLAAAGCRVMGTDLNRERVALAMQNGATSAVPADQAADPQAYGLLPAGEGFDCVLICADSSSSKPIETAAALAREKGRIVVVGLVRTDIPRHEFYRKELELIISRSYGPGRYDPRFELEGQDYPYGYVRWTQTRNMESFLDLLARRRVSVEGLITHRFAFAQASDAYKVLLGGEPHLGMVFEYPDGPIERTTQVTLPGLGTRRQAARSLNMGFIGAGSFSRTVLLPAVLEQGFAPKALTSAKGISARATGQKFGFETIVSSADDLLEREDIETVFIATPHDTHADLVCRALKAGKHVFVEKPLAVTREEADQVREAAAQASSILMVGYNRRFSPFAALAREALADSGAPFNFHYRVNAGPIPADHWLTYPSQGGRVIGEACHFVDLMTYLAGCPLEEVAACASQHEPAQGVENVQLRLRFSNGTHGTLTYITTNRAPLAKERLEIWCGGQVIELDDFKEAWFYRDGKDRTVRWKRAEKGHREEISAFRRSLAAAEPAIPYDDLYRTSLATIEAVARLRSGEPFRLA